MADSPDTVRYQAVTDIEFGPAFLVVDLHAVPSPDVPSHDSGAAGASGGEAGNGLSHNIAFDPAHIVASRPTSIVFDPVDVVVSLDRRPKDAAPAAEARAALSAPSNETGTTSQPQNQGVGPTPENRVQQTRPADASVIERRSRSDGPFDDHTEAGRLPTFPNWPKSGSSDKKNPKGKKKKENEKPKPPVQASPTATQASWTATQTEPKTETELILETAKKMALPESEEEEAAESMRKVNKKFSDFERDNPGKPIPLSRDDLETVLLFDYLNLLKKLAVNRINADGYFFLDPARQYMMPNQIGDVPPGIYNSSDINYVYQGLVSAMDGRTNFGDSAIIGGYNAAQGLPGFFTGDVDSIEHNFNQMEIGPAFAKIGFDFGMNYNNTHE
jgi:hypothetical protein